MNVFERIAAVMQEVGYVQKQGENTFHKYSYAKEADFVRAVRPSFLKHGLLMFPVTQSAEVIHNEDNGSYLTTTQVTFRFQNVEDKDDFIDIPVTGQGTDKGDKGCYKALTGAKKYALSLSLLMETGDDPEADASVDERAAGSGKTTKKVTRKKRSTKKVKEAANGSNGVDEEETVSPKLSSFRKKAKGLKGGW